jgi:hypothetical protein
MATSPRAPSRTEPSEAEIAEAIMAALAEVRAQPVSELREEMETAGGDLEIDSREAEAVIAILETRYGRTLAKVEDLEPECLPSVGSLGDLIHRRWADGHPILVAQRGRAN